MTVILELTLIAMALFSGVLAIIRAVTGHRRPEEHLSGLIAGQRRTAPDPDANPIYDWNDADWNDQQDRRAS
jgi:hypothetical protein